MRFPIPYSRTPALLAIPLQRCARGRFVFVGYFRRLLFRLLDFRPLLFLALLLFVLLFFEERLRGTLAPDSRASLRPMAIACSRLFTLG